MRNLLKNQIPNMFMWASFVMAFGGATYFTLDTEPVIPFAHAFAIICIIIAFIKRVPMVARAVAVFMFGFLYAYSFTSLLDTPILNHNMRDTQIIGTVYNTDYTPDKTRIYIHTDNINVRLSLMENVAVPNIGDTISATATLFRQTAADAPGAFDATRWAYFNNLTATGYATELSVTGHTATFGANYLRDYIHCHANSFLVDGLVLGYKHTLPRDDMSVWISNGIGHVWSISGFHMTLVGGWLFAIFYLLFRLISPITRRIPARVPAMLCAWVGLVGYLFLSGIGIATIRAFLMATLILLAFIFGRVAISLRNVCLAFCILFLINPHYIMQAGFQLSFSAIFGLVWFWNVVKPKIPNNKIAKFLFVAAATSAVATIFTASFVITHFNSLPVYGLIGNLILLPIFSFIIMPMVMIGILCNLCGIMLPLNIAHTVYDYTLSIAKLIANIPGANMPMPYISNFALMLIILGFLCLIFIRPVKVKINYILYAVFIFLGIITIHATPHPVFYVTADHELTGFVVNNKLEFNKIRASNHYFAFDTWKHMNNEAAGTPNIRRKHTKGVYIFNTKYFKLAYIQKYMPLQKNLAKLCNDETVDYIVSYFDIDAPHCNHKILRGGFVIYNSGKIKYTPTNRRWHNQH